MDIKAEIRESIEIKNKVLNDETLIRNIERVISVVVECLQSGGKVMLAGNGGSAADAQHIAAEFVSRFMYDRPALPALALTTDTSCLTAIGNDYGYETVFERQLQANSRKGDVFIGISTSGNSRNVIRALTRCKDLGVTSVGLAGIGGAIQSVCDHVLSVPSASTARIQESHIMIGHVICGGVEARMFPK
jgi:D-sedoheptulose 7-phosphate isomerase